MSLSASSLRGRERGARAFILANAPSVLHHDLTRLRGELLIGMNATPLLDERFGIHCRYYCVSDARFLNHPEKRRLATENMQAATVRVLRAELQADDPAPLARQTLYVRALGRDGFSPDLRAGFYFGSSTTLLAVQLAAHLGCNGIVLLGCDFAYPPDQPRFYPETSPQAEDPMISVQVRNMANAAAKLRARGVRMVQCSPTSALRPYIETVPFESVLAETRAAKAA